jgi:hypothetical protein
VLEPGQADSGQRVARPGVDRRARHPLHAQAERDVAEHVAVREQRVVLEHEAEVALVGREIGEILTVPVHAAVRRVLQAGGGAQQGALPAPTRPEHAHDLPIRDGEIDLLERDRLVVANGELFDLEHQNSPTSRIRRRLMTSTDAAVSAIRIVLAAIAWS